MKKNMKVTQITEEEAKAIEVLQKVNEENEAIAASAVPADQAQKLELAAEPEVSEVDTPAEAAEETKEAAVEDTKTEAAEETKEAAVEDTKTEAKTAEEETTAEDSAGQEKEDKVVASEKKKNKVGKFFADRKSDVEGFFNDRKSDVEDFFDNQKKKKVTKKEEKRIKRNTAHFFFPSHDGLMRWEMWINQMYLVTSGMGLLADDPEALKYEEAKYQFPMAVHALEKAGVSYDDIVKALDDVNIHYQLFDGCHSTSDIVKESGLTEDRVMEILRVLNVMNKACDMAELIALANSKPDKGSETVTYEEVAEEPEKLDTLDHEELERGSLEEIANNYEDYMSKMTILMVYLAQNQDTPLENLRPIVSNAFDVSKSKEEVVQIIKSAMDLYEEDCNSIKDYDFLDILSEDRKTFYDNMREASLILEDLYQKGKVKDKSTWINAIVINPSAALKKLQVQKEKDRAELLSKKQLLLKKRERELLKNKAVAKQPKAATPVTVYNTVEQQATEPEKPFRILQPENIV